MTTQTNITLNLEQGNLPTWANAQAERLARLKTFQPRGWNAIGFAKCVKGLKNSLRNAGVSGSQLDNTINDIVDVARLIAVAARA